ncbi:MAG: low-specificity L-threonine aldolase [Bdellovibrionota bacterium]
MIDLRSDTVTKPTPEMRKAMAQAEVGDDVYNEDTTVHRLQEKAAALLGKEAALFVPSGTMANQISIRLHARPGDEIIVDENSHVFLFEGGAAAALSGVQTQCLSGNRGILNVDMIKNAIRGKDDHFPRTQLIALENTHNRGGGSIYPIETIREIRKLALSLKIPMHLDGARLMNAVVASGVSAEEYSGNFETVSLCLSKGLGAPVGSLVCSDRARIAELRRYRKIFGGGMRQVGVLAAAGLYALEHNIERLDEDHQSAKKLGSCLSDLRGVQVSEIETNIVIFDVSGLKRNSSEVQSALKAEGLLVGAINLTSLRAVTHLDATGAPIDAACASFQKVLSAF